jgi:hypothetical protein
MTTIFLGLRALAFAALAPMAAQANTAVTDCALKVNRCVGGTILVDKKIVTYGVQGAGSSMSIDQTKKHPGAQPIFKVLKSDPLLAQDNNHAPHLNF